MSFSKRLKQTRLNKGLSKTNLAAMVGIHYSQIGRYEDKGSMPSADAIAKIANSLGVTTEFLLNGTKDNLADNTLADKDLLNQFKKLEGFPNDKKMIVKELIEAFILKTDLQKQLAH